MLNHIGTVYHKMNNMRLKSLSLYASKIQTALRLWYNVIVFKTILTYLNGIDSCIDFLYYKVSANTGINNPNNCSILLHTL